MAMEFGNAFDAAMDTDRLTEAAMILVGVGVALAADVLLNSSIDREVPGELTGLATLGVASGVLDRDNIGIGGGVYAGTVLAGRVGAETKIRERANRSGGN
jgi:hypothetical protein